MDPSAIELILRLRDELSPALAQAQQTIRDAAGNVSGLTNIVADSNKAFTDIVGTLKEVGAAFGLAFSVEAAVQFMDKVLGQASALQTLSAETRISTDDLQVLTTAVAGFNISGDQMGKALFQLSQRIAGNDTSVATAYALMGISIDQIKNKDALDLFLTTERGLATLQGTLRDTAAADLYGGRLGASMAALSTGIDGVIDKSKDMDLATKESIKALADYKDAIDKAKASLGSIVLEIAGRSAQELNVLTDASEKGATKWQIFAAGTLDAFNQLTGLGTGTEHTTKLLDDLTQKIDAAKKSQADFVGPINQAGAAMTEQAKAVQFMDTIFTNTAKPILDWQKTMLDQLDALGLLNAKAAAGIGVNVQQLAVYQEGLKATTEAMRIMGEVEAEADAQAMTGYTNRIKLLGDLQKATKDAYGIDAQISALQQLDAMEQVEAVNVEHSLSNEQDRAKVRADAAKQHMDLLNQIAALRLKLTGQVNAGVVEALNTQTAYNKSIGLDASGAVAVQTVALDTLTARLRVIAEMHTTEAATATLTAAAYRDYDNAVLADAQAQDAATIALMNNTKATTDNLTAKQQLSSFSLAGGAGVPSQFAGMTTAQLFSAGLVDAHGNVTLAGAAAGLGTSSLGATQAQFRASGGDVSAGRPYVVGEKRPELFVPNVSGTILPNVPGGDVHYHLAISVTQPLGTPDAIAKAVDDALMARQRNTGTRFPGFA